MAGVGWHKNGNGLDQTFNFPKNDLALSNLPASFSDSLIPNISLNYNALITALPP